jgi:hypothetical protein
MRKRMIRKKPATLDAGVQQLSENDHGQTTTQSTIAP